MLFKKRFSPVFVIAVFCFFFFSAALPAQESKKEGSSDSSYEESKEESGEPSYTIGIEDILEISVWREPNLTKQVAVRPDGKISFPFVGELQAAGVTVKELEGKITEGISKYIPEAVVTVMLMQVKSMNVYVLGAVARPGVYTMGRTITVLQALSLAGGLTPFARETRIFILRNSGGENTKLAFNYRDIKKGKYLEQNITLQSGDVIIVP
ncbi:MAG: polysaccharide biosynthesis/export family protein [bacterium]